MLYYGYTYANLLKLAERDNVVLTFGDPFKILWLSIKDLFEEMFLLISVNFVWVLINLPLFGIAFVMYNAGALPLALAAMLLGFLPMAPANAGLYTVVERITEGRVASIGLFFQGFRENLRLSWQVYLPWGLGLALILINLSFYAQLGNLLGSFLLFTFLYFLLVWFGLLIYIGPLLLLQSDKRLKVIARNAFLMTLGRPMFTLLTVILMGVIVLLSLWLLLLPLLFTFSFLSLWSFRATVRLIKDAEARQVARAEQAAKNETRYSTEKGRGGQIRPRD